jgi:hypothetical protein
LNTSLARPYRLGLDAFARAAGLHPELVGRLVQLGLLDAEVDAGGRLWFAPEDLSRAARIQRLRAGLCLNYAALGVVLDLLDRIEALEATVRASRPAATPTRSQRTGRPWT